MRTATYLTLAICISIAGCAGSREVPINRFKAGDYYGVADKLTRLAAKGDAEAETDLGYMYQYGITYQKDEKRALELYEQAIAQGYAPAETALGVLYVQGDSIPNDYAKAVTLFEAGMKQGDPNGGCDLGRMYFEGWGVPKDPDKWKSICPDTPHKSDPEMAIYAMRMRNSVITKMYYFTKSFNEYKQPAIVKFSLEHGKATHIEIIRSSGSSIVDADLPQAVSEASFPPPPPGTLSPATFRIEATQ